NRGRYYDPKTARWISQDPLGFDAGDSNLYRYAHNNYTTLTDPSGKEIYLVFAPRKGSSINQFGHTAVVIGPLSLDGSKAGNYYFFLSYGVKTIDVSDVMNK